MLRSLLLTVALALLPGAALAADYQLTVKNYYTDAISGLSVSGGKIGDFKRIPANGQRTFTVTLPDGVCAASVVATFSNGHADRTPGKFDFCQYNILTYDYVM